jgi:hypothetical protein
MPKRPVKMLGREPTVPVSLSSPACSLTSTACGQRQRTADGGQCPVQPGSRRGLR